MTTPIQIKRRPSRYDSPPHLHSHLSLTPSHSHESVLSPPSVTYAPQHRRVRPSEKTTPLQGVQQIHSIIKNRSGAVLSRKMILKSDHFDTAISTDVDFFLQGAPNFRYVDFNVFGVAQPTASGVATVLTLLNCHSWSEEYNNCVWFSGREEPMIYINKLPFVLRDEDQPLQNLRRYQGISTARLEQMEARLKDDILCEAKKRNGLLLVHDEIADGIVVPTWTSVETVETQKELFEALIAEGYRVQYIRIPISPDQSPDDRYMDEYVNVIRKTKVESSLVFTCGMGRGRTTFGIIIAMLMRRAQIVASGEPDPIPVLSRTNSMASHDLLAMEESDLKNRALLRLVYVLEKGLSGHVVSHSAIEWALARSPIIDDLKDAVLGNYQYILSLVSVLQDGAHTKRVLDEIINKCDRLVNLREEILRHRIVYSVTADISSLEKALASLERYLVLITFASYVNEKFLSNFPIPFHEWIRSRPEIWNTIEYLRNGSAKLHIFRPVEDLSAFSGTLSNPLTNKALGQKSTELEKYVIKTRQGVVLASNTILKIDQWEKDTLQEIEGASKFRKVPRMEVYGVSQPTIQGIDNIISRLQKTTTKVIWINLREEPLIYVNGSSYVLRDKYFTLRNIKSYTGITPSRLEYIEEKLKEDVLTELQTYDKRILLHGESSDGEVLPIWEDVMPDHVLTLHNVMNLYKTRGSFEYYRVPVTAETPPDDSDFDALLQIVSKASLDDTSIVLNCQVGSGRSTTGTVIACLVLNWLHRGQLSDRFETGETSGTKLNYQVIHSLLRVVKDSLECKRIVDATIDLCGSVMNLRDSIEACRLEVLQCSDPLKQKRIVQKGLLYLKRYFLLICFQCYLNETNPDCIGDLETFKNWFARHPEITAMRNELETGDMTALIPVEQMRPGDGIALTTEVLQVVSSRDGAVLAAQTILKYDMFPGCQKLTLPEKIDGAPNFRSVSLSHAMNIANRSEGYFDQGGNQTEPFVYGVAMPTVDAIQTVLNRTGGGTASNAKKKILWTSMREEPVLYVNGRPYVLRLFKDPTKNIEATGIARERVENMENQMKQDAIAELRRYNGRLLLHEELSEPTGFSIIPVWETVKEQDVLTPLDVYRMIVAQGYNVDYMRLPVTDEQAPIPDVFNQLVDRLQAMDSPERPDAIFNCQMGRGRTTTGMVITCLVRMISGGKNIQNLTVNEVVDFVNDDDEAEQFKQGEYRIILQLISVLQYGKLSKYLADKAIDMCDHMQNLRTAIYDYKLRFEAAEEGSKKKETLNEVGLNYLVRYFYLVAFTGYLIEVTSSRDPMDEQLNIPFVSFSEWLRDRPEIQNIVRKTNQTFY